MKKLSSIICITTALSTGLIVLAMQPKDSQVDITINHQSSSVVVTSGGTVIREYDPSDGEIYTELAGILVDALHEQNR